MLVIDVLKHFENSQNSKTCTEIDTDYRNAQKLMGSAGLAWPAVIESQA